MTFLRNSLLALGLACLPLGALAQSCEPLGTLETDGTGAPSKYRQGGTYLPVEIGKITPDSAIRVVSLVGPYQYVTLHTRVTGGIWDTAYKGDRKEFPGTDPVFEKCRGMGNCTHIVFSLNGAHERYETVLSKARVELCSTPASGPITLDTTYTAPKSGWQIDLPHDWGRDVTDDPAGGTGLFTSPDDVVAVGVTTLDHGPQYTDEQLIGMLQENMFANSRKTHEQSVLLGGLTGLLHRYDMTVNGAPYAAMAAYLPMGKTRMYIVWAMLPVDQAQARGDDATAIMNTFRIIVPKQMEDIPLGLGLLTIGTQPGQALDVIPASAPQLVLKAGVLGTVRSDSILLILTHLDSGQTVFSNDYPIGNFPVDRAIMIDATIQRPASGWQPGDYRLALTHAGNDLGSRMFTLEANQ